MTHSVTATRFLALAAAIAALASCGASTPRGLTRVERESAACLEALAFAYEQSAQHVATAAGDMLNLTPEYDRNEEFHVDVAAGGRGSGTLYRVLSPAEHEKVKQVKGLVVHGPRATLAECQEAAQRVVDSIDELTRIGTPLPFEIDDPKSRPAELGMDWKNGEVQRAHAALAAALRQRGSELLDRARKISPAGLENSGPSTALGGERWLSAADADRIANVASRLMSFDQERVIAQTQIAFADEWIPILQSRLSGYPEQHTVSRLTFVPPPKTRGFRPSLIAAGGSGSEGASPPNLKAAQYWQAAQQHFDGVVEEMAIKVRLVTMKDGARKEGVRWLAHLEALRSDAAETLEAHGARRERLPVPALLRSALRSDSSLPESD